MRPGVAHRWRNGSEDELHLFIEVDDPRGFDDMIEDASAAARAGQTDSSGRPKLFPGAVLMRAHAGNTRPTSPPPALQRLLLPPLALVARALGRRPPASDKTAVAA